MLSCGDSDDLVVTILWEGQIAEENVESSVVEDYNKLVGVLAFLCRFKPSYMVHFAAFLQILNVVVLLDNAFVFKTRVIAEDHPCLCSKKHLKLWLVPTVNLIVCCISTLSQTLDGGLVLPRPHRLRYLMLE